MPKTVIVDDVFDSTDEILELSKVVEYKPLFQGWRSDCIKNVNYKMFVEIVSTVIKKFHGERTVAEFDPESTVVRFHKSDKAFERGSAHIDDGLTAVIYLNKSSVEGTSIYDKHKNYSDTTRKERLEAIDLGDSDLYKSLVDDHMSNFDRTAKVESKFNRALIFENGVYHGADGFDVDDEQEHHRLTLLVAIRNYRIVDDSSN